MTSDRLPWARFARAVSLALGASLAVFGCAEIIGADFDRERTVDAGEDAPFPADALASLDASARDALPALDAPSCGDTSGFDPTSPWPTQGFCNTRVSRSNARSLRKPKIVWRYSLGSLGSASYGFAGAPVVTGDGSVCLFGYVPADAILPLQSVLVCVRDGLERFVVSLPQDRTLAIVASPSLASDGTLVVAAAGFLSAWSPEGILRWKQPLNDAPPSSPALLADGTIVVIGDRSLQAFTAAGTPRWSYAANGFQGSVAVTQTGLLVAGETPPRNQLEGAVHVVSSSGVLQRKIGLPQSPLTTPFVDAFARIVVRSGYGYHVLSAAGDVVLQQASGAKTESAVQPSFAPPLAWFTGGQPQTLDLVNGAVADISAQTYSRTTEVVACGDGSVVFGASVAQQQRVVGLSPDGVEAWSVLLDPSDGDPGAPALGADGTVYFAWGNTLYAIRD